MSTRTQNFELNGRHVLFAMLAFFAAIITVNVIFAVAAFRSFPGEFVKRAYTQGLDYNSTLADRRAQAALGWRAEAELTRDGIVRIRILDAHTKPVSGLAVSGVLRRPADAREDVSLTFAPAEAGLYVAAAAPLAPGQWELTATATRGDQHFDLGRRFDWRPST